MTEVVGVDLGGTKIAFACFDGHELAESTIVATDTSDSEALIDQLVEGVDRCRGSQLDGVGIGVPSIVEFSTGRVVSSANIPLRDVPLRERLGERLGVPVFVDNDATVAALAEAHDEDLRMVARDLVMLTIGTGVGGGLVLGGGSTGGRPAALVSLGIRWSPWTCPARCPRRGGFLSAGRWRARPRATRSMASSPTTRVSTPSARVVDSRQGRSSPAWRRCTPRRKAMPTHGG